MGTYKLPDITANSGEEKSILTETTISGTVLQELEGSASVSIPMKRLKPVLLGVDAETKNEVYWNPDPDDGAANPHVLVLGESGFGKTYTIACILAELAQQMRLMDAAMVCDTFQNTMTIR